MRILVGTPLVMLLAAAGCGSPEDADTSGNAIETADTMPAVQPMPAAVATLETAEGKAVGSATAMPGADGIQISLNVQGLPPGSHGTHVHMVGKCDAPDFKSAGGHWNPADKKHGLENPQGQHAGDMPNLVVADDGAGNLEYSLKGGTLEELLDPDGSAFVIHASADDQETDPSGDSGDRIACGVFTAT